jgi:hypothetical protein
LWLDNYFESAYSGLTFHRGKVKQTMPKSQSRLCVVFFALLTFFSLPKNAGAQITIYSTIGPVGLATSIGFVFQYTNCGVVGSGSESVAAPFTPKGSYSLTKIDLGLSGNVPLTVELRADADGLPGSILESWTLNGPFGNAGLSSGQTPTTVSVVDSLNLTLQGGTQYWVALEPGALTPCSSNYDDWIPSSFVGPTAFLSSSTNGMWESWANPSFQVDNLWIPEFDVMGLPPSYARFHYHHWGLGQTIRLTAVAGPVNVQPGVPVEAVLGFLDTNGNPLGPSKTVNLTLGQTQSLDFMPAANMQGDVLPVVTPVPGTTSFGGQIRASAEVFDDVVKSGTVFEAGHIALPSAPLFAPQGLAGGQTMRITVFAWPPDPCIATLGFEDSMGNPVGPTMPVNLTGSQSASLDLNADSLRLRVGQRTEVQPIVTVVTAVGTAAPQMSACPASVAVFDDLTGRNETYQPGERDFGPSQPPGASIPVAAQ